MYERIAVPVDLTHAEKLDKALKTAAELGRHFKATVHLIAVTLTAPTEVAHNPPEFEEKLRQFAADAAKKFGGTFECHMTVSPDPAADLDRVLDAECHRLGVDLVVMASHVPGFKEYVFASKAGFLAAHTDLSVFVVR